jgi:hypothetical protein
VAPGGDVVAVTATGKIGGRHQLPQISCSHSLASRGFTTRLHNTARYADR